MSIAKLTNAALLAFLTSACAHGASNARVCNAESARPRTNEGTALLAEQRGGYAESSASCEADTLHCDLFASNPHPWCNNPAYGL